ncbi:hypothetical protein OESDEN_00788 [Oesophagostomum dentatum]|uniref:ABC transmembrane type-1 domain-containing protein n=1 Tax=Oesophagostomum dentatum TaxID=61180 RepID=A0A0B1TPQ7_OESDE|nr:hypothetical protein OESDEN_00788 [Oesophagostomum dentatum]
MQKEGVYAELVKAQEIEKAEKENKKNADKEERETLIRRLSRRLSRAFSKTSEAAASDIDSLEEDAAVKKVMDASLLNIIKHARPEWPQLVLALVLSAVRGMTFPVFSIIYGKMFNTLTAGTNSEKLHGAMMNAIWFTVLGLSSGFSTMISGFLFGRVGESFTNRLRITLFSNIVKQDGEYFDRDDHASGKLTTRLSTDAPNIRAVCVGVFRTLYALR